MPDGLAGGFAIARDRWSRAVRSMPDRMIHRVNHKRLPFRTGDQIFRRPKRSVRTLGGLYPRAKSPAVMVSTKSVEPQT